MIKLNNLNPFGRLCVSLGMIPSSYKESMTYEEQLLWMFNYLENTLIPAINEQNNAINSQTDYINENFERLNELYLELKGYVDTYFDNLDVQEEINNKLDEMVEDGTFTEIFAQLDGKIGDLSSLTTEDTSSIVGAVNEIDLKADSNTLDIGNISNLDTSDRTDLVSAINEVNGKFGSIVGNLSNLTTEVKTNVVSAINEINLNSGTISDDIGELSNLTTTAKSSLVASNNEIVSRSTSAISKLGHLSYTTYSTLSSTGNFTLESGVETIQANIYTTDIIESLSGTFHLEDTFTLSQGSSKLIATLVQPNARNIQGGHYIGILDNGEVCDLIIITTTTDIKIYVRSSKGYSAGELGSIYIPNFTSFNLLGDVTF